MSYVIIVRKSILPPLIDWQVSARKAYLLECCMRTRGDIDMRNLVLLGIILLLALSCTALAGLQLSGAGGRAILEDLVEENVTNQSTTNSSTMNSTTMNSAAESGDLWSWGKIPVGHMLNSSGILTETPNQEDPSVVIPPRGGI